MNGKFLKITMLLGIFFIGLSLGSIELDGHDDRIQDEVDKGDSEIQKPGNDYKPSDATTINHNLVTKTAKSLDNGIKSTFNGVVEGTSSVLKYLFGR